MASDAMKLLWTMIVVVVLAMLTSRPARSQERVGHMKCGPYGVSCRFELPPAPRQGRPADETEILGLAARIAAAVDCGPGSRDPGRVLCAATRATPQPLLWPRGDVVFWGLSLLLLDGEAPRQAIDRGVVPRTLHFWSPQLRMTPNWGGAYWAPDQLAATAPRVSVTVPRPADPGDGERENEVFVQVERALGDGHADPIVLPAGRLGTEEIPTGDVLEPRRVASDGVDFDTDVPAHLDLVENPMGGRAYVAIERLARGYRVSIFPLVPYASALGPTAVR